MHKLFWAFILICSAHAWGQSTDKYNSDYADFYRAEELFLKEQYGAARKEFHDFIVKFPDHNDPFYIKANYYEGLSALELYQNDGVDLLETFNKNYPESIYKNAIYFRLGKYYYQKKDYEEVLVWLKQLDISDVEPEDKEEYYFKLGYSYFDQNQLIEARSAFHEVKDGITQYANPSLYYYSHIAYVFASYQTALDGFEKLKTDEKFSAIVPYYIAQIYYLQGRYAEVPQFAPVLTDEATITNQTDINLLIGDSYYRLGKYAEAVPYLEKYDLKAKTTRENDYQLGNAYFKSKIYDKAIRTLDRTTRIQDTLSQFAYYQIGESYLALNEPIPARAAFEAAANMDFKPKITEDALYQFAVLSYKLDLNPYDEAVIALERYINKYPNSSRKEDVYQYLVNVYTTTNNYGKALQSLDRLPNKDIRLKSAYQVIAYNAGVEQYQKSNYDEAIRLFDLVEKYPLNATVSGKGKFWAADAQYQKQQYRKAIQGYRTFLNSAGTENNELRADAYYNIGYADLVLRDTAEAIESFKLYTQQTGLYNKTKLADAYMRIGDGYYSARNNEAAVNAYSSALLQKAGYEDQALFYLGKTYGFLSKLDDKIKVHQDILTKYPKSKYVQASIEEIANTCKLQGNFNQALKYYEQIVNEYPQSNSVKGAMVEIADIYYKKGDYARAETEYKKVLSLYSSDRLICEAAGKNLIDVYKALRQPEKLQGIIEKYPCANLGVDEQEDLYYGPAYDAYSDSSFTLAIPQISKYLDKYPNGKYANEMQVFLANSYERTGNEPEAIRWYRKSLEAPTTAYTEFAALKVSKYLYNGGQYAEALPYYKRLETVTSDPEVLFNAELGVMRSSFLTNSYAEATNYAEKILKSSKLNPTIRLEAEYARAMGSYKLADYDKAQESLDWIAKNNTKIMGSEAKFTQAESYFKQGNYTQAKKHITEFYKRKPSYDFYVAKTLILETRVFMQTNDLVQAEQKLKSVRDNYPFKDDGIIDEANVLWDELMILKNQPKNIDEGKKPIIEVGDGK
jgi:tetratricopeptide (TPR) repeat protein